MITKLHHRTAQTCVRDMWAVEWFENIYTHGCYGEADFWEDLINYFDEGQVLTIREMIDREATCEEWDDFTEALQ